MSGLLHLQLLNASTHPAFNFLGEMFPTVMYGSEVLQVRGELLFGQWVLSHCDANEVVQCEIAGFKWW